MFITTDLQEHRLWHRRLQTQPVFTVQSEKHEINNKTKTYMLCAPWTWSFHNCQFISYFITACAKFYLQNEPVKTQIYIIYTVYFASEVTPKVNLEVKITSPTFECVQLLEMPKWKVQSVHYYADELVLIGCSRWQSFNSQQILTTTYI